MKNIKIDFSEVDKMKCECRGEFVCNKCSKIYDLSILEIEVNQIVNQEVK